MRRRMEIAFFCEGNIEGKITREYEDMRTDMAWMCTLNADRIPYFKTDQITKQYDLGICIIPKRLDLNPQMNFDKISIVIESFFNEIFSLLQIRLYRLFIKSSK